MQSTSGPSKQWMEGDVVVMKPYKNAADNGRVPERDLDSLGKHAMDGYTFFQEGVIALNNVADAETFARLEKEGTLLLNSNKTGNILFDGDAPAAYRHQVKLRPTKDSSRAAEIIKFSTGLLQQLQQSLPDLVTKHHKVEYMALIANVQGKSTCAQLLHCDRALRGGGPDDMRAYCFVAHVPLTKEGQTLSVLLGSHAYERHNYSATTARLHHVKTGLTGALLHVGHLIHAGFSSKEGLQNMRLVINYSAQEPPKGVDSVLPHFINGGKTETHFAHRIRLAIKAIAWSIALTSASGTPPQNNARLPRQSPKRPPTPGRNTILSWAQAQPSPSEHRPKRMEKRKKRRRSFRTLQTAIRMTTTAAVPLQPEPQQLLLSAAMKPAQALEANMERVRRPVAASTTTTTTTTTTANAPTMTMTTTATMLATTSMMMPATTIATVTVTTPTVTLSGLVETPPRTPVYIVRLACRCFYRQKERWVG